MTTSIDLKNPAADLNDAIRFNGAVTLSGDFGGFKEFDQLVTKNTKFGHEKFGDVMKEFGSVAKCPLGLFSIGKLTIVDAGRTRVY